MSAATRLAELLELERDPVAVAFLDTPPEGLPRTEQPAAAICSVRGRSSGGVSRKATATGWRSSSRSSTSCVAALMLKGSCWS